MSLLRRDRDDDLFDEFGEQAELDLDGRDEHAAAAEPPRSPAPGHGPEDVSAADARDATHAAPAPDPAPPAPTPRRTRHPASVDDDVTVASAPSDLGHGRRREPLRLGVLIGLHRRRLAAAGAVVLVGAALGLILLSVSRPASPSGATAAPAAVRSAPTPTTSSPAPTSAPKTAKPAVRPRSRHRTRPSHRHRPSHVVRRRAVAPARVAPAPAPAPAPSAPAWSPTPSPDEFSIER